MKMIDMAKSVFLRKTGRDSGAQAMESEIKNAIRALRSMNDRELDDIGVRRHEIEQAVRFGIAENDSANIRHVS